MAFTLPLLAVGFLLGLIVGRWWVLLVPVIFGLFGWAVWSEDREVNAVAAGLLYGGSSAAGALFGLLIRLSLSAGPGAARPRERWRRWLRLLIGLEPKDPERPTALATKNRDGLDDQQR